MKRNPNNPKSCSSSTARVVFILVFFPNIQHENRKKTHSLETENQNPFPWNWKPIPLKLETVTFHQNHIEEMEASSSSSANLKRRPSRTCYCPNPGKLVLVVSWTESNPGRRFYGCPNYWVRSELFQIFFSFSLFFSGLIDLVWIDWFGLNWLIWFELLDLVWISGWTEMQIFSMGWWWDLWVW